MSPLVSVYELHPDRTYLVICEGKKFSMAGAHSLMKDIRELHPELMIAIVATTDSKGIQLGEKIKLEVPEESPVEVSPDEPAPH